MSATSDSETASSLNLDPTIQTEIIAFVRKAMVACGICTRNNPPNRPQCLYCGSDLGLPTEVTSSHGLRKLESWEIGINVVICSISRTADIHQAATLLSLENEDLLKIVESGFGIPIARVESEKDADLLIRKLERCGFRCFPLSDEVLAIDKANIRISGIDFLSGEFGVTDFNTGRVTRFAVYEIALAVEGVISKTRVDSIEKRRLRGESKLVDQLSVASEDRVLDIYPANQAIGFSLIPSGFDFSCLGSRKSLLASENWGRLTDMLKEKLPSVKFVNDYTRVREALAAVWEIESRNETKGLTQTGFGKREFGSVSTTSNLIQFNRYSRLQRHIL